MHRLLRRSPLLLTLALVFSAPVAGSALGLPDSIVSDSPASTDAFPLVASGVAAPLWHDAADHASVIRALGDLRADLHRVTDLSPALSAVPAASPPASRPVIIGTVGHSALVDSLLASGKLDATTLAGRWEGFVIATIARPLPGVDQALVIAGSDRRGTLYGIYELSRQIGVSPWYWWADVPVPRRPRLFVDAGRRLQEAPAVKYRGIFINDEDWGLHPWAAKTFEPEAGGIGPKTYAKIFELMLRLRLNYVWPAMHECSREFERMPESIALADHYGIVAGSSHCEPMLCNNIHWDEKARGPWNYSTNRDVIHSYWEWSAKTRGRHEAVWTLGIRGIHDRGMAAPPEALTERIDLVRSVIADQRALLDRHVSRQWGPVAQCFVPYKEVLPIYDAGLEVPDDVTLVWVDDNFGYIRRLGDPRERKRSGGSGVYYHLSYYGGPHSYLWINTTAPALMWEELHKAWENEARNLWVLNVGDIKSMEIGLDYFARLAWRPHDFPLGAQRAFLRDFAARELGAPDPAAVADLLMEFYRLGTVRKPELMNRAWALSLPGDQAARLERDYRGLLARNQALFATIPAPFRDTYTETVGLPADILASSGLIFLADRKVRFSENIADNEDMIARLRTELETKVRDFNTTVAGGKWRHIMPGPITAKDVTKWNSQVRWPWGEKASATPTAVPERRWRPASDADRQSTAGEVRWSLIEGLGSTGRALALKPTDLPPAWGLERADSPALEYGFTTEGGDTEVLIDFLPTFRLYPGMKLRVAARVDAQPEILVEVPGSGGQEDENGSVRQNGVQDNYVRARFPLRDLGAGRHTFSLRAIDPGVVIDRVSLP